MKLWLISQNVTKGYDTYDSAVVAAETEDEARAMHPGVYPYPWPAKGTYAHGSWASDPEQVTATLLAEALPDAEGGVVLASFNAG